MSSSLGRRQSEPPGTDKRLPNCLLWSEDMKGQRRQELVRRKTVPAASQRAGVAQQKNNSLSSAPRACNETHRYHTMMSHFSLRSSMEKCLCNDNPLILYLYLKKNVISLKFYFLCHEVCKTLPCQILTKNIYLSALLGHISNNPFTLIHSIGGEAKFWFTVWPVFTFIHIFSGTFTCMKNSANLLIKKKNLHRSNLDYELRNEEDVNVFRSQIWTFWNSYPSCTLSRVSWLISLLSLREREEKLHLCQISFSFTSQAPALLIPRSQCVVSLTARWEMSYEETR